MDSAAPCSQKRSNATPYASKKWAAFSDTETQQIFSHIKARFSLTELTIVV